MDWIDQPTEVSTLVVQPNQGINVKSEDKFSSFGSNQRRFFQDEKEAEAAWVMAGPGRYHVKNEKKCYGSCHNFNSKSVRYCLR